MHGRLKVKSSAEQQEAKRKQREVKVKLYKVGIQKIFEKRKNEEFDDEALNLTKDFLLQNPHIDTLWNYRRTILLHRKSSSTVEDIKLLASDELELTQQCLATDPKAYGTWHHRFWTMEFMPDADWFKELKLCNYFLSLDERNFHCWDYRRLVCKKCSVKPEDELAFTTDLIKKNFSNYSSWHYRSKLLPVVYPGVTYNSIDEKTLLEEYDLVQNAAFTDPNDQSVWFYHQWLLGRSEKPLDILSVSVVKEMKYLVVLLSHAVQLGKKYCLSLQVNGMDCDALWKPVGNPLYASTVWYCDQVSECFSVEGDIKISLELKGFQKENSKFDCTLSKDICSSWKSLDRAYVFCSEISAATKDVLEKELESCTQLNELEPDSKWTLYTSVLLMRAIDSDKYQDKISDYLEHLSSIDCYRRNYYKDIRSKFIIENVIQCISPVTKDVSMKNKKLCSLHHFDHFIMMEKVDLSDNLLTSIPQVHFLLSVQDLILDDNQLNDCKDIQNLPCLKYLSLQNNNINSVEYLRTLTTCSRLKYLLLKGNPVIQRPDFENAVKNILSNIILDGKQL